MTYEQAEEFAESTKKYGSILGLESIRGLMHLLGDVQEELNIIHVAGTNGKGSVCAFLSAALSEEGYRVGRFNSPAVFERREVFRIGERMIEKTEYADIMERIQKACQRLVLDGKPHPTVFEVETAAAFLWCYEKQCDVLLLETGMGGESDATNLISSPVCSVLTSVGMDHMQYLGTSLREIAAVKAGIIKKGCPVVALKQSSEVNRVIEERAEKMQASCIFAEAERCEAVFAVDRLELHHPCFGKVETGLAGKYQKENLTVALTVLEQLEKSGYHINPEHVRNGIAKAVWPGRFEVIAKEPLFLIDGAHNPPAVARLQETIEKDFTNRKIIYIIGVLADKEHAEMMGELLRQAKKVYTITPDNPRALDGRILAKEAKRYAKDVAFVPQIADAVKEAYFGADKEDVIVAFGSLSCLGEIKRTLSRIDKMESTGGTEWMKRK